MAEEELLDRIRGLLTDAGDVVEKRIFGGVGFMVNGTLRLAVSNTLERGMMIRVRPKEHDTAAGRPGASPAVMRGRTMRNYLSLEPAAVAEDDELADWVAVALRSNDSA